MKSFVLVLLIVSSPKQTSRGEERSPSQSQTNRVLYFLSPTPIMTNTWKRAGRAKSSQPQWLFLGNKWWLIDFCTPNQMWFKWNDRLQGCTEENLQQAHALPGSSKAETLNTLLNGKILVLIISLSVKDQNLLLLLPACTDSIGMATWTQALAVHALSVRNAPCFEGTCSMWKGWAGWEAGGTTALVPKRPCKWFMRSPNSGEHSEALSKQPAEHQ